MPSKKKSAPRTDAKVALNGFTSDIARIGDTVRPQIADDKPLDRLILDYANEAQKALDEYEQAGDQGGQSWVQRYKARLAEVLDQYREACRSRWPGVKLD